MFVCVSSVTTLDNMVLRRGNRQMDRPRDLLAIAQRTNPTLWLEKQNPQVRRHPSRREAEVKASFSSSQALCKSLTFLNQTVRKKEQSVP